eukprot:7596602-Lingulodinium_polyedra.AAC.1
MHGGVQMPALQAITNTWAPLHRAPRSKWDLRGEQCAWQTIRTEERWANNAEVPALANLGDMNNQHGAHR